MSNRKRRFLIFGALVLVALVVLTVLVVPRLVNVDRYRPQVAALLEEKTGKPAHIGRLELTLLPRLAIQVDDFSLGNPKGFPPGDFFKAQRVEAVLSARALWDRKIVIESLVVKKPAIHLLSNTAGHWNFENPSAKQAAIPAPRETSQAGFSLGEISKVTLDAGQVTVANLLPSGQRGPAYFEGHGISCRFQNVNPGAFTSGASTASSFDGAGPGLHGFPAILYADAHVPKPAASGTFQADSLHFGAIQATAVRSYVTVFPKRVLLDDLSLNLAGGSAKGKVSLDLSGQNLVYRIQTAFQKIDAAQLLQAFPEARGKMTGTVDGQFDLGGEATHSSDPLSGVEGTGQVSVRNGRLPSLQLNKNLITLVQFAGLGAASGDPSSFSLISADLNLANQRLTSHHVKIVGNGVGVDAAGNLALGGSGRMDYIGTAEIAAKASGLTHALAGISGATFANGKLSFPFGLQGTLANPRFELKSAQGALSGLSKVLGQSRTSSSGKPGNSSGNLLEGITNLFSKKKSATKSSKP